MERISTPKMNDYFDFEGDIIN